MKKLFKKKKVKQSSSPEANLQNDDFYHEAQAIENNQNDPVNLKIQDIFPSQMVEYWRKEHLELRKVFKIMFFIHIVFLTVADIYAYSIEIMLIIADIFLIWLDYYNFMTLNKITIIAECGLQGLVIIVSLSHAQRLFSSDSDKISILFYFLQFIFVYPLSLVLICLKFRVIGKMEREIKDQKLKKTLKGKIKVKIRQTMEKKLPVMARERFQSFLAGPLSDPEPENNIVLISQLKQKSKTGKKDQVVSKNNDIENNNAYKSDQENKKKQNFLKILKDKQSKKSNSQNKQNDDNGKNNIQKIDENIEKKEEKAKIKYKFGDKFKTIYGKIQEQQVEKKEKRIQKQSLKQQKKLEILQNDFKKWMEDENIVYTRESESIQNMNRDSNIKKSKWWKGKHLKNMQSSIKELKENGDANKEKNQLISDLQVNFEKQVSEPQDSVIKINQIEQKDGNQIESLMIENYQDINLQFSQASQKSNNLLNEDNSFVLVNFVDSQEFQYDNFDQNRRKLNLRQSK